MLQVTVAARACKSGEAQLHRLSCGHFVGFNTKIECMSNCSRFNETEIISGPEPGSFIICDRCIKDEWFSHYPEAIRRVEILEQTAQYKAADEIQQAAMRDQAMQNSRIARGFKTRFHEVKANAMCRGGLASHAVENTDFPTAMADLLTRGATGAKDTETFSVYDAIVSREMRNNYNA